MTDVHLIIFNKRCLAIDYSLFIVRGRYYAMKKRDRVYSSRVLFCTCTCMQPFLTLKADQLHSRDYLHTPTDYRHTEQHLRLVMTLIALCCTRPASQMDGHYQVHYLPARRLIMSFYIFFTSQ